jgi:hypothetical protein
MTHMTDHFDCDTVVLINVLELFADPVGALERIYGVLNSGERRRVCSGSSIPFDHWRRYTRSMLAAPLKSAGYRIVANFRIRIMTLRNTQYDAGWPADTF